MYLFLHCIVFKLRLYYYTSVTLSITFGKGGVSCNNTKTIQDLLQVTINNISNWSNQTGFKFSPSKSQSICLKKKYIFPPIFQINELIIPNKNTIKILGIIFDKKLSWKPHIKYIKKETTLRSYLLKVLPHTTWESRTQTLIQIYKSLIISKLEYGAEIYSSAKNPILKIIDPIHNLNLRLSIGGFKSSPVESFYVTANETLLWIRRIKIALTFAAKLKKNDLEALIPKHLFRWQKTYQINLSNIIKYEIIQTPPCSSKINLNTELEKYKESKTDSSFFLKSFLRHQKQSPRHLHRCFQKWTCAWAL
jgi:hypothetical protein